VRPRCPSVRPRPPRKWSQELLLGKCKCFGSVFQVTTHPSKDELAALCLKLNEDTERLRNWFENRRAKERKEAKLGPGGASAGKEAGEDCSAASADPGGGGGGGGGEGDSWAMSAEGTKALTVIARSVRRLSLHVASRMAPQGGRVRRARVQDPRVPRRLLRCDGRRRVGQHKREPEQRIIRRAVARVRRGQLLRAGARGVRGPPHSLEPAR